MFFLNRQNDIGGVSWKDVTGDFCGNSPEGKLVIPAICYEETYENQRTY